MSCVSFFISCATTPPVQYQETEQDQTSLIDDESKRSTLTAENVDVNEGQSTYINMDERTFIDLLNENVDQLSLIEGIWSNKKNTYKIGIQKAKEKGKYFAFILNSQDPFMQKGEMKAEFTETRYENIYATEYYLKDKSKVVTKSYIDEHEMLLIFLEKWEKEDLALFRNSIPTYSEDYYVQVVALKNLNDTQKLLVKIKKYYPDAYIAKNNNFNIIRIPGVSTKEQGAIVSRDIENKFKLKPILVLKTR